MLGVRGEADVQHAPAHVPCLHRSEQVEASPGGVIQADVLVYGGQKKALVKASDNQFKNIKNAYMTTTIIKLGALLCICQNSIMNKR